MQHVPNLFNYTRQSNELIDSIITGDLEASDYRLFQLLVSKIPIKPHYKLGANGKPEMTWRANIKTGQKVEITVKEYSELYDIRLDNCYDQLANAMVRMLNSQVRFQFKGYADLCHLFELVRFYDDGRDKIEAVFGEYIIPHLSMIDNNFTTINLDHIKKFKCNYSYRFYSRIKMYCCKFGKKRTNGELIARCDLAQFREFFELDRYNKNGTIIGRKYKDFQNLKARVIYPAINDINTYSDLHVKLVQTNRPGQKVTSFDLVIKKNPMLINEIPCIHPQSSNLDAYNAQMDKIAKLTGKDYRIVNKSN